MRISDWSSDVCSSDLLPQKPSQTGDEPDFAQQIDISAIERDAVETQASLCNGRCRQLIVAPRGLPQGRSTLGRASCWERVFQYVYIWLFAGSLKKKLM